MIRTRRRIPIPFPIRNGTWANRRPNRRRECAVAPHGALPFFRGGSCSFGQLDPAIRFFRQPLLVLLQLALQLPDPFGIPEHLRPAHRFLDFLYFFLQRLNFRFQPGGFLLSQALFPFADFP